MTEEHIIISSDRFITVPKALQRIAVQYDHNIETVTFDCPRYWDGHDMSKMVVYINYMCANKSVGMCLAKNITVDETDPNIMHFDWTISRNASRVVGKLSFLVCIKRTDEFGLNINHWNSELNQEMYVSEGLECAESTLEAYPDIITHLLVRMDTIEGDSEGFVRYYIDEYFKENPFGVDDRLSLTGLAADAKVTGDNIARIDENHDSFVESTTAKFQEVDDNHDGLDERFMSHADRHSVGSDDPVTPEMIGAVNKTGDTMTGDLTIEAEYPYLRFMELNTATGGYVGMSDGMFQVGSEDHHIDIFEGVAQLVSGTGSNTLVHDGNAEDLGIARIATGIVTGSHTAGEDNPNSVTLPGSPKLVIVSEVVRDFKNSPWNVSREFFIWMPGIESDVVTSSNYGSIYRHYRIEGNTLYWWMSDTDYSAATFGVYFGVY